MPNELTDRKLGFVGSGRISSVIIERLLDHIFKKRFDFGIYELRFVFAVPIFCINFFEFLGHVVFVQEEHF